MVTKVPLRVVGQGATTFDDRSDRAETHSYHDYRRIILDADISGWTRNIAGCDIWHRYMVPYPNPIRAYSQIKPDEP